MSFGYAKDWENKRDSLENSQSKGSHAQQPVAMDGTEYQNLCNTKQHCQRRTPKAGRRAGQNPIVQNEERYSKHIHTHTHIYI